MSGRRSPDRLREEIREAISAVDDPEYPGLSIVDLGLLETIRVRSGGVTVGLVPTFSGCPALAVIAEAVRGAVGRIDGIDDVDVVWLRTPSWSTDRVTRRARRILADSFSVAVQFGQQLPTCPRCGEATAPRSAFGPSRCRAIHTCSRCREPVEVLRG
ncbi:MAG: phenylacetate-CoA oxygenase subunit PaaJ [Acidobacteria bacterium]|nr:phenylacetate-CoA oxygenase subunit PaaJ [Acidobacteriota bacterium]